MGLLSLIPPFDDEADEALLELKAGWEPLWQRHDELKMIEAYRGILQPQEKQKQEIIDNLKDNMTAIAEDIDRESDTPIKSAFEHVSEPMASMSIAAKNIFATRAVTRSQTRTETQSMCHHKSFKAQEYKLTKVPDDICKSSMGCDDQLLERDQTVGKQMVKEKKTAKWATEVATDFGEAKKLSEAAEASGLDLQAERDVIIEAMLSVSDRWARSRDSLVVKRKTHR